MHSAAILQKQSQLSISLSALISGTNVAFKWPFRGRSKAGALVTPLCGLSPRWANSRVQWWWVHPSDGHSQNDIPRLTIARVCPPVWSLRQQLISSHVLLTSPNNIPQPSHFLWMICLRHSSLFHYIMNRLESSSGPLKLLWRLNIHQWQQTPAPLLH